MARNRRILALGLGVATTACLGAAAIGITVLVEDSTVEVLGIGTVPVAAGCDAAVSFGPGEVTSRTLDGAQEVTYSWPFEVTGGTCASYQAVAQSGADEDISAGGDVSYTNQALTPGAPFVLTVSGSSASTLVPAFIKVEGTPTA